MNGLVDILRENNQKIVFTNGCFDLLHPGHVDYLAKAKAFGDVLMVGLNSDASVQTLKGEQRPINKVMDRLKMLAALEAVDFVIIFEEDTPLKLIQKIKPDYLVKGGDYSMDNIVGSDFINENGGKVEIIPFLNGYSSSELIEKIKTLK
ncbi:MAG: D-glycero-beta-D-manno-heptose 1-phosphate adenylyltransferase [Saprospiraceae bacterium]|nr:D-glycero-beta-D-manno-heptose 1-phosphate adenylyltransferase [Saprospiraceae bacterium]NNL92478.1 D-glycero-beta-D-manno-heptose 1-phosphate adenylyltransferase [Saprospiraceae bacterium]